MTMESNRQIRGRIRKWSRDKFGGTLVPVIILNRKLPPRLLVFGDKPTVPIIWVHAPGGENPTVVGMARVDDKAWKQFVVAGEPRWGVHRRWKNYNAIHSEVVEEYFHDLQPHG